MNTSRIGWLVLWLGALGGMGCSSSPDLLYEDGDPPKLRNGSVVMRTTWHAGSEDNVDIRRIYAQDGVLTCELVSPRRGHLTGTLTEEQWQDLWAKLMETEPFSPGGYDIEPDDPSGGPYHVIRMQLGRRFGQFSAQLKRNLLIFSSRDVHERMEYVTAIVDLVTSGATRRIQDVPAPAKPAAGS